jgi:putative aldouronate transport system substrate-binding protein
MSRMTGIALSLLATAFLATGVWAAGTEEPRARPKEPVRIEYMLASALSFPEEMNDFVRQQIKKDIGVDVLITHSVQNFDQALTTRFAAGDPPEVAKILNRNIYLQLAQDGALLDWTPYLKKLAPYTTFVGFEDFKSLVAISGKSYALPLRPGGIGRGNADSQLFVRKDWLDKLGLKVPATLDELVQVAVAFAQKDPDGNGKKDTIGMSSYTSGMAVFDVVFGGHGTAQSPMAIYKSPADGRLHSPLFDAHFRDALAYSRRMLESGALDAELLALPQNQRQNMMIEGRMGIWFTRWPWLLKPEWMDKVKGVNPGAQWEHIPDPKGPYADYAEPMTPFFLQPQCSPADTAKKPEVLDALIRLFNYTAVPPGLNLVCYGQEGRHWKVENGAIVAADMALMTKEVTYSWPYQFAGRLEAEYLGVKFPYAKSAIANANARKYVPDYTGYFDVPKDMTFVADLRRYSEEQVMAFVTGKRPLSEFDDFVRQWRTTFKGDVWLDLARKQGRERFQLESAF